MQSRSAIHSNVIVVSPPQPRGDTNHLRVTLRPALQLLRGPAQSAELLLRDPLRLGQSRLPNFLSAILGRGQLTDLRQEFLPKLLPAQIPASRFILRSSRGAAIPRRAVALEP
jgi:hypothetical protein